jgi:uncharacterized protein YbaR (Trm112 family)
VKARLLEWMACPWCGGAFAGEAFEGTFETDVVEGVLKCQCGRLFPIVRGIPRILPDAFALNPDFVRRHAHRLPASLPRPEADAPHAEAIRRTRDSFGYQWTVFSEMVVDFRENFLQYIASTTARRSSRRA